MASYLLRRLGLSLLILLAASFLVYQLIAISGDPLAEFRDSNKPNKAQLMQQRTALLNLNVPAPARYFIWLTGVVKCVVPGKCDLGKAITGQPVTQALGSAIPSTLQLVTAAELLAVVIGIIIGILTALRQYSGFDYTVTFVTFLFFSLPSFWVAVLLKQFGAIKFNTFLGDPTIGGKALLIIAVVGGLLCSVLVGGGWLKRWIDGPGTAGWRWLITFAVGGLVTFGIFYYLSVSQWFAYPGLGPVLLVVFGVVIAVGATVLFAGLQNRRALFSTLATVVLGVVAMYALKPLFDRTSFNLGMVALLGIAAVAAGVLVGFLMGGYDRRQSMKAAALTSFLVAGLVLLDRFMIAWPDYAKAANGRPIGTIGSSSPTITNASFWITNLDKFSHLVLPTIALLLISLASYTRYSRASMLEVMGQDYVRTARAKGLSERVVVTRHAFRNALIPLATVVAFDIGQLLGGAVITENVFSIKGMGQMFVQGLQRQDPNPVMGFFLVVGISAVTFNLLADLAYSALDPRVRVTA
ncbi:MAG: ABC transporter permease [Micrococcales bacterium]|nr:ABC transporter permease [Micrococcales bacterium]